MSLKRSVTVDMDELFDQLCYYDKISFVEDKIINSRHADKMKIINNAITKIEMMDLIRANLDTALIVLKSEGYNIH